MKKRFVVFALAAFLGGFAHCAHARLLVFGPELFTSEAGKTRKVSIEFFVPDTGQEFMLSVQGLGGGDEGIKAAITLNGARLTMPGEFRERMMITQPLSLQTRNEITVETTGATDGALLVTVINMSEKHTAAAEIPPLGDFVELGGYALVIFPNGSFGAVHDVTVTLVQTPSEQYSFEGNDTVLRLPFEIRINTGGKPPKHDVELSVKVPDSFIASDYAVSIFARFHDNPDAPDKHDWFYRVGSGLDDEISMLKATLPKEAFSSSYGRNGTYEAVITGGLIRMK